MTLDTGDGEDTGQGTAPSVPDCISEFFTAAGFAYQAPVYADVFPAEIFHHFFCAVDSSTFFITGQEQADSAVMGAVGLDEAFQRGDHCGHAAFHIGRAAAVQVAAPFPGFERR